MPDYSSFPHLFWFSDALSNPTNIHYMVFFVFEGTYNDIRSLRRNSHALILRLLIYHYSASFTWTESLIKVAVSARLFFIHIMCGCCCVAYARFILKLDTLGGLLHSKTGPKNHFYKTQFNHMYVPMWKTLFKFLYYSACTHNGQKSYHYDFFNDFEMTVTDESGVFLQNKQKMNPPKNVQNKDIF